MTKYLMSNFFLALIALTPIAFTCSAQTQTATDASAATSSRSAAQQSPQLAELDRLDKAVVSAYSQKKYDDALRDGKQALQLAEKILPSDDPQLLNSTINLAMVYLAIENYREAKTLFQRSLTVLERKHGTESPQLLNLLDRLSFVAFSSGDKDKAEELTLRALAIREKSPGQNREDVYKTLAFIAQLYQVKGDYREAERYLLRLIQSKEKETGAARKGLREARSSYISLLYQKGREQEATDLLERMRKSSATEDEVPRIVLSSDTLDKPSDKVLKLTAIRKPSAPYPATAKQNREQGTIPVRVLIDERGVVVSAHALKGVPSLSVAATQTARLWRFSPPTQGGRPVLVVGIIVFNFTLQ